MRYSATNRRKLVRTGLILVILLSVLAWFSGLFTVSSPQVIIMKQWVTSSASSSKTTDNYRLPIVYMDPDIKNKSAMRTNQTLIPKILHQTWKSYSIPAKFVPLVRTWQKVNPDLEYWFWTDDDAARFIKLVYPEYNELYRNYPQNIHRADAMRYFILHYFGGWYADMDIQAIKPLDDFSRSHHCIISQEPWAHTKLFWNKNRLACNALMAARARHPFFDLVIKQLPDSNKRTSKGEVMDKTGPKMIDRLVTMYEQTHVNDKYPVNESLYLAAPDAFLPTVAANALALIKKRCKSRQPDVARQKICDEFKQKNFANEVPATSYTNHVWVHTYYGIDEKKNENIFTIVPGAKNVKEMLDKMEAELMKSKPVTEKPKPATEKPKQVTEKPKPATEKPKETTEKPKVL